MTAERFGDDNKHSVSRVGAGNKGTEKSRRVGGSTGALTFLLRLTRFGHVTFCRVLALTQVYRKPWETCGFPCVCRVPGGSLAPIALGQLDQTKVNLMAK